MSAEADALCGAPMGERSADRINQRNGYRESRLDTRVGSLELAIPKLRAGSYFPNWLLEPRRRAERALVAECYVRGVSTRRVEGLVATLGIASLSKSPMMGPWVGGQRPRSWLAPSVRQVLGGRSLRWLPLSQPGARGLSWCSVGHSGQRRARLPRARHG